MKKSYKIASAAMLAAMGVGLAVASETKATTATGSGKIQFTDGTLTETTDIPPPDTTDPTLRPTTGIVPGTEKLQFTYISPFDFKTHDLVGTAPGTPKTYDVDVFEQPTTSGGTFKMPHFVRFRDVRNNVTNNWQSIQAAMTTQFTLNNPANPVTLDADLEFSGVYVGSAFHQATKPTDAATKAAFTLDAIGTVEDVYLNQQVDKGFGEHELVFGTYAQVNASTTGTYDAIQLKVPASTLIREGTYNAVITWTLADAP